jgi:protein O-mannosyl-transferase
VASRSDWRAPLACSAAVLLAALAYLNALHNPYVYDDYHTVVGNASLLHPADIRAVILHDVTRPVINLSYAIDHAVWGPTPFGYHVTNVLLHMFDVALLFVLGRRIAGGRIGAAFAGAALFAVHPMMTEAVGYISGRSELLCAIFFLAALLCGDRWLRGGASRWTIVTIGFWSAALASKEIGAMWPFVFLCYDRWVVSGTTATKRRRLLRVHVPLIAIAVCAGFARLAILRREYPGAASIHWSYVLIGLDVIRRYLWLMVIPRGQTIFHEVRRLDGLLDPRAMAAIGLLGLIVALAWRARRSSGVVAFGVFWFILLLLPSLTLTAFDQGEPMAEHRVYLASCGLFLAAGDAFQTLNAWAATRHPRARPILALMFSTVLLSFGVDTLLRNAMWRSPSALWRESVALAPMHYRPRLLLGEALQDEGRRAEAAEQYETAIQLRPSEPIGYVKLGRLLASAGQSAAARQLFHEALHVAPGDAAAKESIAVLDRLEGTPDNHGRRR